MGKKTDELIDVLEEIIKLLETDNEEYWTSWCSSVRKKLLNSDFSGITNFLKAFGGMGSFNDLVLGQSSTNGEFFWTDEAKRKNEALTRLRIQAFELANYIKKNAEIN